MANPVYGGQSVTLTINVTGGGATPTGTVNVFYECVYSCGIGFQQIGSAVLHDGTATLVTGTLTARNGTETSYSFKAIYLGDTSFAPSESNVLGLDIQRAPTTTTLSASPNPSTPGQSVTFTATVTPNAGASSFNGGGVSFYDGATLLGTSGLDAGGTATFTTNALTAGSHSMSAQFNNSWEHLPSTGTLTHVVSTGPGVIATTTSISTAANPTFGGLAATLTIGVASTSGTPTGTVKIFQSCTYSCGSGFNEIGSAVLSGGTATFNTSILTARNGTETSYTFRAIYAGDASFAASQSSDLVQAIERAPTTTSLSASPNPSTLGQTVTFTATVTPNAGASSFNGGGVSFYDGGTYLGASGLGVGGTATFTTNSLSAGSHSITAQFNNSWEHLPSTGTLTHVVSTGPGAIATTTSISTSANPMYGGLAATLTINVGSASGTPTGTVKIFQSCTYSCGSGFNEIGSAVLGGGTATFNTSILTARNGTETSYTFRAIYAGDASFAASQSADLAQAIERAPTTTTLSALPNPSILGQTVTFTATVTPNAGASSFNGGGVSFYDGGTYLGASGLGVGGTATFTTNSLSAGSHSITAQFNNSWEHLPSTSAALVQPITGNQSTTTNLQASASTVAFGQSVTFTVTVTTGSGTPTGTVTFRDGSTDIGTATLSGGSATFSISSLAPGTRTITAFYNGTNALAFSSTTFTVTVSPPTITVTSASLPAATFGATYTAPALTASGGASPYTFAASGLPTGLTLDASTGVISGTPTASGTFTVNVTATDATTAGNGGPFTSSTKALTLTVAGPTVTVSTATLPATTLGSSYTAPALTASGGASPYTFAATGLPTGLTLDTSSGVISGTPTASGTFTVNVTATDATTAGNGGPFTSATKPLTLTVSKATQTISFTNPGPQALGGGPIALVATATSGLTVGFVSNSPAVCTVAGAQVALVAVGTCSITARQAGDASYAAAADVTQTFAVTGTSALSVTSATSPKAFYRIGQTIAYTFTVTNIGSGTVNGISVHDTRAGVATCASTSLAAGGSTTCTGATTATAGDIRAKLIGGEAVARGTAGGAAVASPPVQTIVGIDVPAVQRATSAAIQSFNLNRANVLTTTGAPSTARLHERLGEGSLFGGEDTGAEPGFTPPAFTPPAALGGPIAGLPPVLTTTPGVPGHGIRDSLQRERDDLARQAGIEPADRASRAMLPFGFEGSAGDGSERFSFSTSLGQMRAAGSDEQARKLAAVGGLPGTGLGLPVASSPATASRVAFDVWAEGMWSRYRNETGVTKRSGETGVFSAGADYVVMPGLLVGAYAQFDRVSETSGETGGLKAEGHGWMAGPYVSARLTRHLYFDARAAWGRSSNSIDPLGAYTDHFDTTRALYAGKLTGQWAFGALTVRPSAELIYFVESQNAYTNAIGIGIDGSRVSIGRLAFGPEVSYRFDLGKGAAIEPFVGLKGVWDFSKSALTTEAGIPVAPDDLRGKLEAGVSMRTFSGVAVRASGSFDGLGDSSFRAYEGRASVVIPLQ